MVHTNNEYTAVWNFCQAYKDEGPYMARGAAKLLGMRKCVVNSVLHQLLREGKMSQDKYYHWRMGKTLPFGMEGSDAHQKARKKLIAKKKKSVKRLGSKSPPPTKPLVKTEPKTHTSNMVDIRTTYLFPVAN
tara:strand:- start:26 stop:421 length:396 start_codon:yes stop_codon:yes gene_type:complete